VKLVPIDRQLVYFMIDAQDLFWLNYHEGTIMRCPNESRLYCDHRSHMEAIWITGRLTSGEYGPIFSCRMLSLR
jgi:hypothetical protein